jgi:hypothetical protein
MLSALLASIDFFAVKCVMQNAQRDNYLILFNFTSQLYYYFCAWYLIRLLKVRVIFLIQSLGSSPLELGFTSI